MSIPSTPGPAPAGLRRTIRAALTRSADPWLPDVAPALIARAWRRLAPRGFFPGNYGTHRWLEGDPAAERPVLAALDLGERRTCRIETLPASSRIRYESAGLVFPRSVPVAAAVAAVRSALAVVGAAPGLLATVAAYPRSAHVLQPPATEIDVSYSDPDVPFSVFLSIPRPGRHAALRLAESLAHECMHLQLTLIEAVLPLVEDERASTFSPWQRRPRPLRGVLHGLYVFSVIDAFLEVLERGGSLEPDETRFAARRRRQIAGEIAQVDQAALAAGLTGDGKVLAGRLLRRVGAGLVQKVGGHGAEDCTG